ncbi:MAG: AAA family ATPase, partial [Hyphomicrobiaceae bacterium]
HGKLTDHNGKQIDFRNVILIMTTNAGASDLARAAIGFNRSKREGDDQEAINRLFTPEFRNRLDAVISFSSLPAEVITKVVEKFIFQLEAQLADRGVTIELSEQAAKWIAEKGYDEKFGARPLARVIQEYIKKPLAEELLFGKLEHGGTVRVLTEGEGEEKKLVFEYLPGDPAKAPRSKEDDEEVDSDEDVSDDTLVGASPKKALPGPKERKERAKPAGAVPSVPRRKDE